MKKKIAVIFGGKSPEHEVSIESAKTVCAKLREAGFVVLPFYAPREGAWRLVRLADLLAGRPLKGPALEPSLGSGCFLKAGGGRVKPDAAFPIIHGSTGEDGVLQGFLELLGLRAEPLHVALEGVLRFLGAGGLLQDLLRIDVSDLQRLRLRGAGGQREDQRQGSERGASHGRVLRWG